MRPLPQEIRAPTSDDKSSDWETANESETIQIDDRARATELLENLKNKAQSIERTLPVIEKEVELARQTDPLLLQEFQLDVAEVKWILEDLQKLALGGILGLTAPNLDTRIKNLEEKVNVNPGFLVGVQEEIRHLGETMTSWRSTLETLPGWQGNLEQEIRSDTEQIKKDVEQWRNLVQQSPHVKKIMESNRAQLGENTYPVHLNDPQLASIQERNRDINNAVIGNHENQVKLWNQVEDLKKIQGFFAASLGILGMSALGYIGRKGFIQAMNWYQNGKRQKRKGPKNPKQKAHIKKRLHARDFQEEEGFVRLGIT